MWSTIWILWKITYCLFVALACRKKIIFLLKIKIILRSRFLEQCNIEYTTVLDSCVVYKGEWCLTLSWYGFFRERQLCGKKRYSQLNKSISQVKLQAKKLSKYWEKMWREPSSRSSDDVNHRDNKIYFEAIRGIRFSNPSVGTSHLNWKKKSERKYGDHLFLKCKFMFISKYCLGSFRWRTTANMVLIKVWSTIFGKTILSI